MCLHATVQQRNNGHDDDGYNGDGDDDDNRGQAKLLNSLMTMTTITIGLI